MEKGKGHHKCYYLMRIKGNIYSKNTHKKYKQKITCFVIAQTINKWSCMQWEIWGAGREV